MPSLAHAEPEVYAAHAGDTWPQVESEAEEASAKLAARCEQLGEEELTEVGRYVWMNGQSAARTFGGYGIGHTLTHLEDHHRERGDSAEADRVHALNDAADADFPQPFN